MLCLKIRKRDTQKRVDICTYSVLYIIMVTLIPVVGLGDKGSNVNTLAKAVIIGTYLIVFLFKARLRISVSILSIYIFFSYVISQFFSIANNSNATSTINVLVQTAVLFAMLFLLPTVRSNKADIVNGIKVYLLFDVVAILSNIILHFQRFANLSFLTNVFYDMYSFFDNKNTYGMILFVGLVLLFYWYYLCDNPADIKWIRTLVCVQFSAIAISMCRTALLCSIVFLLLNFLYRMSSKKILIATVLLLISVAAFCIPAIRQYLLFILFRIDVGTFREPIIKASLDIWRHNILFGCGEGNWEATMEAITGSPYSHNGFLSVLMTGGIIYLLSYTVMLVHTVKRIVQIRRINSLLGNQFLYATICLIIYALFEAVVLCAPTAASFTFTTAMMIIPQLYYNMAIRHSVNLQKNRTGGIA